VCLCLCLQMGFRKCKPCRIRGPFIWCHVLTPGQHPYLALDGNGIDPHTLLPPPRKMKVPPPYLTGRGGEIVSYVGGVGWTTMKPRSDPHRAGAQRKRHSPVRRGLEVACSTRPESTGEPVMVSLTWIQWENFELSILFFSRLGWCSILL